MVVVYIFYYEQNEIVDHDEYGAVYEMRKYELGAFLDYKTGKQYYEHQYPNKEIKHDSYKIEDAGE